MNNNFIIDYYSNLLENIFKKSDDEKEYILFIENDFNILDNFSFIIKKKNLKINIVINNSNKEIYNKLLNHIKGEECEENISIYLKIRDIINKKIDYIVFFHLESIENLDITLKLLKNVLNNDFLIYIYASLSNKSKNIIKNIIREQIIIFTDNRLGFILSYEEVIKCVNKHYKIDSIKILKKNNYFIYGNNTVYEIILSDKNIIL